MNEEGAPFDSGFDDAGPFSVTPDADGVALDAALREFGPAAFEDLLPRLRTLAADLDAAHGEGFIHGRLHPSKVFITDEGTFLLGARVSLVLDDKRQWPVLPPYTAPEVVSGGKPAPPADQFALAAIVYEWMFGRPISGPADRSIDVRAIPNVDRAELARAFTRALTPEPFRRFALCTDFCDAIAAASAPALPLIAAADDDADEQLAPFLPEDPPPAPPVPDAPPLAAPPALPDLSIKPEQPPAAQAEPDLDSFARTQPVATADPVDERPDDADERLRADVYSSAVSSAPTFGMAAADRARFGGFALILATLVGAVFGFAAGYMARPRALQSAAVATGAAVTPSSPDTASAPTPKADAAQAPQAPAPAPETRKAPPAPKSGKIGSLLVRSTPSGATVAVDGVTRGVTPLTLRDLDLGSRSITVSQRGYVTGQQRVALTDARPSRTVDVRLAASAPAPSPRPAAPARPAVTTGSLAVESRPSGATVTVDGKPSGVTPVMIADLSPGEYRVTISLEGFRPVATTVRVVAGERARAAARLTEQEQE